MQDRLDRAILGRDQRSRGTGPRPSGPWQPLISTLVRQQDGLILLLAPPFDHPTLDPGYIKGYVPGIRENGGQYTHAATWVALAFAELGDGDTAGEAFPHVESDQSRRSRAPTCSDTRWNLMWWQGMFIPQPPHVGRGGWTWYSGSAGWLYRVGLESILGFRLHGMTLSIDPCMPRNWPNFSITFRYHSAVYKIRVENPSSVTRGVALMQIDGKLVAGRTDISLSDDAAEHKILVVLG